MHNMDDKTMCWLLIWLKSGEDVYQNVTDLEQAGVANATEDISVCHRLLTWSPGPKTNNLKFVRRWTKPNKMANLKTGKRDREKNNKRENTAPSGVELFFYYDKNTM